MTDTEILALSTPASDTRREGGFMPANSRKVFIKSHGCQMNAYDAARMADALAPQGYEETDRPDDADVVILNTCHIRERATEKVFSELGRLREMKEDRARAGRTVKLVVAGCVAQAEGEEIVRRQPAVDVVVGPQNYHRLPAMLRAESPAHTVDTEFPLEDKLDHIPMAARERIRSRGLSAFVTIQEGCDKFCTFCVVPYTRGAEVSRPPEKVLAEIRTLVASGVREVTLLGQNVNAYHGVASDCSVWSLADLVRALAMEPALLRVRYTTSHPNDMTEDLIAAHRDLPTLMPFLHLPVQSGSDRVLAAMNRKHTAASYIALVERIRAACPNIALSSDFIVGFPGETESDFQDTLQLIRDVGFASTFFFTYSPRIGTPGALLAEQVDEPTKKDRLTRLSALVEAQRHAFNASAIGRRFPVLVEKAGRHPGQLVGKSPFMQPVHVEAHGSLIGTMQEVEIEKSSANSLFGRILSTVPACEVVDEAV